MSKLIVDYNKGYLTMEALKVLKSDYLTVLKTGRNIVVVPVLIEGATVMGVFFTIEIFCVEPVVE